MKNRITFFFLQGLAASVVGFLGQDAKAQTTTTLYDNASTSQVGNYVFGNGGNEEVGNEIVLAGGPQADITSFTFQFFFAGSGTPTGSPAVTLNFYNNNGPLLSGFSGNATEPGASLYSQSFSLTAFTGASVGIGTAQATLTFSPNVVVNQDFTWTVTFSGVTAGESAGLSIFNGSATSASGAPLPATGNNYNDAWVNTGTSASPTWSLTQSSSVNNPGLQFGASAVGYAVPEPSTIALGIIGAGGFLARRRKS